MGEPGAVDTWESARLVSSVGFGETLVSHSADLLRNFDDLPEAAACVDFGVPSPGPEACWVNEVVDDSLHWAPDVWHPLVDTGGGAPKGLSQREHCAWALLQDHPWSAGVPCNNAELKAAVEFECMNEPGDIDVFRNGVLDFWRAMAFGR